MIYAEYYVKSALDDSLVPMCGSDGVHPLDGRKTRLNQCCDAVKHADMLNDRLRKGIKGYRLMAGRSFSDSRPLTEIKTI